MNAQEYKDLCDLLNKAIEEQRDADRDGDPTLPDGPNWYCLMAARRIAYAKFIERCEFESAAMQR